MTLNNKNLDDILNESLKLYDEGKSISEIFDLFPEYKEDLKEIFEAIELVGRGKDFIEPPKEFLSRIIENISVKGITYLKINRLVYRGKTKGRPSIVSAIINQIHQSMNLNWKIAIPTIAIVATIAGFFIHFQSIKEISPYFAEEMFREQQFIGALPRAKDVKVVDVPEATGNVDDVIDAVLAISLNEDYLFDAEVQDAELMDIDNQMINEFGQSYGEDNL